MVIELNPIQKLVYTIASVRIIYKRKNQIKKEPINFEKMDPGKVIGETCS